MQEKGTLGIQTPTLTPLRFIKMEGNRKLENAKLVQFSSCKGVRVVYEEWQIFG